MAVAFVTRPTSASLTRFPALPRIFVTRLMRIVPFFSPGLGPPRIRPRLSTRPGDDGKGSEETRDPTDISVIPDVLVADPGDGLHQLEIMKALVGSHASPDDFSLQRFLEIPTRGVRLSQLKSLYKHRDHRVLQFLSDGTRHTVEIDDQFCLKANSGKILMDPSHSTIDYRMMVGDRMGLSPLLPNMLSCHNFSFHLDLKMPYKAFRGKHAMLGFDPAGRMLYIGQCNNEDVYLAMVPDDVLSGQVPPSPAGFSTGHSVMSARHYRQVLMMIVHFLADLPKRSFMVLGTVYEQDLDSVAANFDYVTDALADSQIHLNYEELKTLDGLMVRGYDDWVEEAPRSWKADGFLEKSSPVVVTSRFGQDARIGLRGSEERESESWRLERDYSKVAFLTIAIATSIQYVRLRPSFSLFAISPPFLIFRKDAKRSTSCDPFRSIS